MLADEFDQVLQGDEAARLPFIRTIAEHGETAMPELMQILEARPRHRWPLAFEIIGAIGYPNNAVAIPRLVIHLAGLNDPYDIRVTPIIQAMPSEAVIPYILDQLWDKGPNNPSWYFDTIHAICRSIASQLDSAYAVHCGPLIVLLMSRYGTQLELTKMELEPMLWVIEKIGPADSLYAMPILFEILHHPQHIRQIVDPDVYSLAESLWQLYPADLRACYARVNTM